MTELSEYKQKNFIPDEDKGCSNSQACAEAGYCLSAQNLSTLSSQYDREVKRNKVLKLFLRRALAFLERGEVEAGERLGPAWVKSNCLEARPEQRGAVNLLHNNR